MATTMQVPPNGDLLLGLICKLKEPGHTIWKARLDERFTNPSGVIQGGYLSAICDSAMGASAVTSVMNRKVYCSNAELKISFLRPVYPNQELTCEAWVIKGGKTVVFVEAELRNDEGLVVAKTSSTYVLSDRKG